MSIDPRLVGGFLARIDAARTHAANVADAMVAIRSGHADVALRESHLFGARMEAGLLAGEIRDATAYAAPRDATEAAQLIGRTTIPDVLTELGNLERAFSSGGDVLEIAARAQRSLNRLTSWELDDVALRATQPTSGTSHELGAVLPNGAWATIEDTALAEMSAASRRVTDEQLALIDDLADVGSRRSLDGDSIVDPDRWNEEIAADELARALDADDAATKFAASSTSSAAALASDVAEIARTPQSSISFGEFMSRPAAAAGKARIAGEGSQRLINRAPGKLEDLAVVHHINSSSTASALPYKASGVSATTPTRDEAFELARGRAGHWFVMPHVDGRWRVVEALPHPEALAKLSSQLRLGHDAARIEQVFGRIDGYFVDGHLRAVSGPPIEEVVDGIVAARGTDPIGRTAFALREVAGLEPHADGIMPRMRSGQASGSMVPGTSTDHVVSKLPAQGDVVTVLQYRGARGMVELPVVAEGRSTTVPTRDMAVRLAKGHTDARWAILPDATAGWHVVEVRAVGSNIDAANSLVQRGASIAGVRQSAGRVDVVVERGRPTWVIEQQGISQADFDLAVERMLAPARPVREPVADVATPGAPLVGVSIPARRFGAAAQLDVEVARFGHATIVHSTLGDALEVLSETAAKGARRGVHALLELERGKYGVVPAGHPNLSGGALKALYGAMETGAPVTGALDDRVRAIAVSQGRNVRVIRIEGSA